MRDFKVITNPNSPKNDGVEEIELELTLYEAETVADLYLVSAFFHYLQNNDGFYFAERVLSEEEIGAMKVFPLLERNFSEFIRLTERVRRREHLSLGQLIYCYDAQSNGYVAFFDDMVQSSFLDFFKQAFIIMNPEVIYTDDAEELFDGVMQELMQQDYFDEVMQLILGYLDDEDNLYQILFSEEEE